MAIKVNFAGVQDQKKFDPAPPGVYVLKVTDYKETTVKSGDNAGADMITWTHEIVSDDKDLNNRKVWDVMVFTDKALFRLKGFLKALGYEVDDSEDAQDVDFDPDTVLGEEFRARLSVEPKSKDPVTGKEYPAKNKIARFLMPDEDDDE